MILVVGITGATGVIFGVRLLEVLASTRGIETHLIISQAGETTIKYETARSIEEVNKLASFTYDIRDVSAGLSSGSFRRDGMVIIPCTVKTMSAIANSYTNNLITRAADVTLKERQKLVLCFRETPLHLGHLRNLVRLTEMGAVVMPPVPSFYHKPETIQDIIDYTVGKILDMFGIQHQLFKRWSGYPSEGEPIIQEEG